ncbi:MAG: thioredoxin-disulfide reductase [Candidatus Wallacebacter cryptica]|jgi:thioredoxin reductase (NADPH)|nr:thioredoxin-disulfide reductase [Bacillota bacterium]
MYDLAILGGGPGGLTAGMYAGRANLKTIVIDKGLPGGQMQNTLEIENYPGFKNITGAQLSELLYEHMLEFGAEWKQAEIVDVNFEGSEKQIVLAGGETISAKAVIIATGTQPRRLNVPGETLLAGRGVSYCATCDGAFFRNKQVVVVGGGDSAVEEGIFLTRFAAQVTIIHRRDQLRAAPILQKRAFANDKINFIWDTVVEEIVGENRVTQVKLKNVKTGEASELDADGVFIYIGYLPNTGYLKNSGVLNDNGFIDTDEKMATKIPGVFAIGDVRETYLRQIVTAAGDGALAAMSAYHYLETL